MKKSQKGFTIIEVALVLAIGALIFLVVFLAVPALQRNQRNDARHRDVSNIVTAVTSWAANNTQTNLADAVTSATQNQVNPDSGQGDPNTQLGKYLDSVSSNTEEVFVTSYDDIGNPTDITNEYSLFTNDGTADGNPTRITIVVGAQCDGTAGLKDAPARSSAVVGSTETTAAAVPYCSSAN